jgi:hypothetical protein
MYRSRRIQYSDALFVSCILYAYIIFDTMSDTEDWAAAFPMILTMILSPFLFFVLATIICFVGDARVLDK